MRLQIATLVALVASSSVLAVPGPTGGDVRPGQFGPRRGDIQLGKSSGTRGLLTDKQTKLLGDKGTLWLSKRLKYDIKFTYI